jgi:uncharacterized pyridoxamine 5'-phosphate oxidase family protein
MQKLSPDIIHFFQKQGFVIVSTLDANGTIHCSAKGIVGIEEEGRIYLIDLYKANTFNNLQRNPLVSITAVNEHSFTGYTLKGEAKIIEREEIKEHIIKAWEDRVISRITKRVVKSVQTDKKSRLHPESRFPSPQYLIEIDVEKIIDLAPAHLVKSE